MFRQRGPVPFQAMRSDRGDMWDLSTRPRADERWAILSALLKERLNPLSLDLSKFVAARTPADGSLAGFGQLKPLGEDAMELSSLVVLPPHR